MSPPRRSNTVLPSLALRNVAGSSEPAIVPGEPFFSPVQFLPANVRNHRTCQKVQIREQGSLEVWVPSRSPKRMSTIILAVEYAKQSLHIGANQNDDRKNTQDRA